MQVGRILPRRAKPPVCWISQRVSLVCCTGTSAEPLLWWLVCRVTLLRHVWLANERETGNPFPFTIDS